MASDESNPTDTAAPDATAPPAPATPAPAQRGRAKLPKPVLALVGVLVVVALLASLRSATAGPSAREILDNPTAFEGLTVTLKGEVKGAVELPLVGGGYTLVDADGTAIHVKARDVPGQGTRTTVTGTVKVPMQLGSKRLVYIQAAGAPEEP